MKKTVTSKEIKPKLLFYALYMVNHLAAFTEYGGRGCNGIADVFSVMRSGYTHEFEIKVTKSDLMSEVKSIKYQLDQHKGLFEKPTQAMNKRFKHRLYLDRGYAEHPMVLTSLNDRPNRFSFVVPSFLANEALAGVANTPYGVISINEQWGFTVRKKADLIHKDKITEPQIHYMLRKAATEVQNLREAQLMKEVVA